MRNLLLSILIFPFSFTLFSQDIIVLKSGKTIRGKIIEVRPAEVVYKREEILTGPDYIERKEDICFLQYPNGYKEVFNNCSGNSGYTSGGTVNTTTPVNTIPIADENIEDLSGYRYIKLPNSKIIKVTINKEDGNLYTIDVYDKENNFLYETRILKSLIIMMGNEKSPLAIEYNNSEKTFTDEIIFIKKTTGELLNILLLMQDNKVVYYKKVGGTDIIQLPKSEIEESSSEAVETNPGSNSDQGMLYFKKGAIISVKTKQGTYQPALIFCSETDSTFSVKSAPTGPEIPVYKATVKEVNEKPYSYTERKSAPAVATQATKTFSPPTQAAPLPRVTEDPSTSGTIMKQDGEEIEAYGIIVGTVYVHYMVKGHDTTKSFPVAELFRIKYKNGTTYLPNK